MSAESKETDPPAKLNDDATPKATVEDEEESSEEEEAVDIAGGDTAIAKKKGKKRKSKKKKIAVGVSGDSSSSSGAKSQKKVTQEQLELLLQANPALKAEVKNMTPGQLESMMSKLNIADLLTGVNMSGTNNKNLGTHAFWGSEPVPQLDEDRSKKIPDGPIKEIDIERVPKAPGPLVEGFEWVLMDLTDDKELDEVFNLLSNHYVEDADTAFRFAYSASFLHWYVASPRMIPKLTRAGR